jgi:hypothetical protein
MSGLATPDLDLLVKSRCFGQSCPKAKHLVRRAGREKCSAPRYSGSQRRDLDGAVQLLGNGTLHRRMIFPNDPQDTAAVETFVFGETKPRNGGTSTVWRIGAKPFDSDVNTALFRDFTRERSLTAVELKGCTMLYIIGRKGVYVAHYWENISFAPDRDENFPDETDAEAFQRTVIGGLRDGLQSSTEDQPEQASLTEFAQKLGDEHLQAYLVRPRLSKAQDDLIAPAIGPPPNPPITFTPAQEGYPQEWQMIRNEVVRILPVIGTPGRWQEIIYEPVKMGEEGLLETSTRGRALFKFDPEHVLPPRRSKEPPGRLAKLWVEQREVHTSEWTGD